MLLLFERRCVVCSVVTFVFVVVSFGITLRDFRLSVLPFRLLCSVWVGFFSCVCV